MEEKEKEAQEAYMQFQMFDQQIKIMQKQLEVITQHLMEIAVTSNGLDEFEKAKPGKEIFVPISSGIFAKAILKDNSELLVNVGANTVIVKDLKSTKMLISNQAEEMKKVQKNLVDELNKMISQAGELELRLQGMMSGLESS